MRRSTQGPKSPFSHDLHGTREGIKVALSPLVTDAPILLATWLVLSRLTGRPAILGLIALVGAGVLTRYAWDCFRPRRPAPDAPARVPHSLRRGVVANFCNPHPYLFWAAVGMPTLLAAARVGPATPILFLATFYATIVSAKICIAVLAGRFRIFLASRAYRLLMIRPPRTASTGRDSPRPCIWPCASWTTSSTPRAIPCPRSRKWWAPIARSAWGSWSMSPEPA